ncbi:hypothetical protein [Streptomyces exfoliatus]|uniref:hypothetical protein n=1 Tax=Streptomyces exfoliatus TaxID=1905 RepID=UPI00068D7E1D|nr:hypothetical protein [Streptomyces exfoliatus]
MNVTTGTGTGTAVAPTAPTVEIDWSEAFCSEGANCFRFGLDDAGRAYIGSTLAPGVYVSDSVEALRALISAVKAGEADHLL